MERLTMTQDRKELAVRLTAAMVCAAQTMIVLTVSLMQIIKGILGDKDCEPNIPSYALGFLVLLLLFSVFTLPSRRPLIILFFLSLLLNLIGVINYYECRFHGTVLTHQDINNIGAAARQIGNYTFTVTIQIMIIIFCIIFLAAALLLLGRLKVRYHRHFAASATFLLVLIAVVRIFVFSRMRIVEFNGWSWEVQYCTDSYVVATIENIAKTIHPVSKPDGYDPAVLEKTSAVAGSGTSRPDIILILNETYYDINHLIDFHADAPFMENYERLDAYKGYATVPIIGGGTNASEYELLTSNSMDLINTSTPFNDLDFPEGTNSIVRYLETLGYCTMAAHSAVPSTYHRGSVWKELGFDQTYFIENYSGLEHYGNRTWVSTDSSDFKNFIQFYESLPDTRPRFGYLLTIQNHGDWNHNDPELDTVHVGNSNGFNEYNVSRMNEFLSCLKLTDDFIQEIIDYFSKTDRDVIVCMVGDHAPSIVHLMSSDNDDFFEIRKREVPYFIWTNYTNDYTVLSENSFIDLCALSPYVMALSGLYMPPYYESLVEISREGASCFTGIANMKKTESSKVEKGYELADRTIHGLGEEDELTDLINKYFYMEYNNLEGKPRLDNLFICDLVGE